MKKSLDLKAFITKYHIGEIAENYDFSSISSIKLGGIVKYYIRVNSVKGLKRLIKYLVINKINYYPIGCATNSYTRGFDGAVISLCIPKELKYDKYITLTSNYYANYLAKHFAKKGISTFLGLTMIPGLISGAIAGNASVMGIESTSNLRCIWVIKPNGRIKRISKKNIIFCYRSSNLNPKDIIIKAQYFVKRDKKALEAFNEIKRHRLQTQPIGPSLGSIFKNGHNYYAGSVIEKVGLKGFNYNGILISKEHANIWINRGGSIEDFIDLIYLVRLIVLIKFKILLIPEVKEF